MEALEAIMTRRSTRKYAPAVPENELIEKVLEAGRYAPSGGNSQTTHFLVITKPEILSELAWIVQTAFAKMEITDNTYASLKHSVNASRQGGYIFHYNAPVLIVTANKKGYGNAMADSSCALENMMIAANALNLGSCWINQLHWLDEDEAVREYLYGLGLAEDETVTGALALGYAAEGLPNRTPLPRTGNPVTRIPD
ncbi:MAG: nitroreductase family protein [Anaerolineaceae bacterium]|nr:nitroreductase family protein [Anaerolineaceae bacterium]